MEEIAILCTVDTHTHSHSHSHSQQQYKMLLSHCADCFYDKGLEGGPHNQFLFSRLLSILIEVFSMIPHSINTLRQQQEIEMTCADTRFIYFLTISMFNKEALAVSQSAKISEDASNHTFHHCLGPLHKRLAMGSPAWILVDSK